MAAKKKKSNAVSLKWAQSHPKENAERLAGLGIKSNGSALAAGMSSLPVPVSKSSADTEVEKSDYQKFREADAASMQGQTVDQLISAGRATMPLPVVTKPKKSNQAAEDRADRKQYDAAYGLGPVTDATGLELQGLIKSGAITAGQTEEEPFSLPKDSVNGRYVPPMVSSVPNSRYNPMAPAQESTSKLTEGFGNAPVWDFVNGVNAQGVPLVSTIPVGGGSGSGGGNTITGQTVSPGAASLKQLPYKVGGYTDAEMQAAYGNATVAPYRTGYNYANDYPYNPTFTAANVGESGTGNHYAGYYKASNGNWYPINTKKVQEYYKSYGKGSGGGGGDSGGGDGGSSGSSGTGSYNVENAPTWWQGIVLTEDNEANNYANMLNAAIPFMSPEDQQAAATYLATNYAGFAAYKNIAYAANPTEITTGIRDWFGSSSRATQYLDTLTKVAEALGKTEDEMGSGFKFLRNVGDVLSRFSGGAYQTSNMQTRNQYLQMITALDPLLNQATSDSSPYASIANYLSSPTFSAGPLMSITKNDDGTYSFGAPNTQLY